MKKFLEKLFRGIGDLLNPNKKLPVNSYVWYILALGLVVAAVIICIRMDWQNGGEVRPIYKGGVFVGTQVIREPVLLEICPDLLTSIWAIVIIAGFWAKGYIRNISNIPTLVLVACDVTLLASLIRSFLPAESVELFCFLGIKKLSVAVNPQKLLVGVVLFSWLSMRTISGFGIIVLFLAFISRMSQLNLEMGVYGVVYIMCGFFSFLIQSFLPYVRPEEGYRQALMRDMGRAAGKMMGTARQDLLASVEVVEKGVSGVAALAGCPLPRQKSSEIVGDGHAGQIETSQ